MSSLESLYAGEAHYPCLHEFSLHYKGTQGHADPSQNIIRAILSKMPSLQLFAASGRSLDPLCKDPESDDYLFRSLLSSLRRIHISQQLISVAYVKDLVHHLQHTGNWDDFEELVIENSTVKIRVSDVLEIEKTRVIGQLFTLNSSII